ncbi:Uncharacterized protein APZ42_018979 [Daphnia magna]|uniref:Uncharacterized protein n=1 Tax=Daphnia magna TaxID=35525 RepID=A0A162CH12_9CRUS|nr:Uncharacterized protein APZ42_018979 [Daphnia magna]
MKIRGDIKSVNCLILWLFFLRFGLNDVAIDFRAPSASRCVSSCILITSFAPLFFTSNCPLSVYHPAFLHIRLVTHTHTRTHVIYKYICRTSPSSSFVVLLTGGSSLGFPSYPAGRAGLA